MLTTEPMACATCIKTHLTCQSTTPHVTVNLNCFGASFEFVRGNEQTAGTNNHNE